MNELSEFEYKCSVPRKSEQPPLPLHWFGEIQPLLDTGAFVEGLMTSTALSLIYGDSNSGKTFFIVDLGLHISLGKSWRGRYVDQGAVIYIAAEGGNGILNRVFAFKKHFKVIECAPFVVIPAPVSLFGEETDLHRLLQAIEAVRARSTFPIRLIIIDTLSRTMAGGDENSPADMTGFIRNVDQIRQATGVHVCLVHHTGKDKSKGARGHSSLRAAVDTEIEVQKDQLSKITTATVTKQRDLPTGDTFDFVLEQVTLGSDRHCKPVTSCVVVPSEATAGANRGNRERRLPPSEQGALRMLKMALAEKGHPMPSGPGDHPDVVADTVWREYCRGQRISQSDNPDSARRAFDRASTSLRNKGIVRYAEGYVWLGAGGIRTGSDMSGQLGEVRH